MSLTLTFWQSRDNTEDLVLLGDSGQWLDPQPVSRVRVEPLGGVDAPALDSSTAPALFEWPATLLAGPHKGKTGLRLRLAGADGWGPGRYTARLITFDPDHPDGLVWETPLLVVVYA